MISPSTHGHDRLPAPSPEAIAELTRPDGRVLVLGEHLGRLRALAEGLLRAGCRVEIAALPGGDAAGTAEHRLTLLDTIDLGRTSAHAIRAGRLDTPTQPMIALAVAGGARHRSGATQYVVGEIDDNGDLLDVPQIIRDILSTWTLVRPLIGPGDLCVDRVARRASVRGRQLALRPLDFRVLRVLAEHIRRGCTIDELCAAAFSATHAEHRRAVTDVRSALERLRSRFRRSDVVVVSTPDGRYRLTTRLTRSVRRR